MESLRITRIQTIICNRAINFNNKFITSTTKFNHSSVKWCPFDSSGFYFFFWIRFCVVVVVFSVFYFINFVSLSSSLICVYIALAANIDYTDGWANVERSLALAAPNILLLFRLHCISLEDRMCERAKARSIGWHRCYNRMNMYHFDAVLYEFSQSVSTACLYCIYHNKTNRNAVEGKYSYWRSRNVCLLSYIFKFICYDRKIKPQ